MTNEEARKAIEKYQKEHPLHFGAMLDVTAISSKAGADIISQTIEQVAKKVDEDTELWCICEMAKMYMQGVRPVYLERSQGQWDEIREPFGWDDILSARCSVCGESYPYPEDTGFNDIVEMFKYCPNCGAKMEAGDRWKEEEDEE